MFATPGVRFSKVPRTFRARKAIRKVRPAYSVKLGRDPFNQSSNRSDREKRTTSKGGPVFSKFFRLDRTDPLSFGPKFPEILVEWIAPLVFSYVVKGIKIKVTAKFRASRRFRFEDTKRIMSPEIRPKSFGTFEKQAPGIKND